MKKILSVILSLVLILSCTGVALAQNEATPVIVVSGMGSFPLYDSDSGEQVFPPKPETIIKDVLKAAPPLVGSLLLNKWEIFGEYGMEPICDLFEKLKADENGNPVYNIEATLFPGNAGQYEDFIAGETSEKAMVRGIGEAIGFEKTFFFNYDWRLSPLDLADDLKETVDSVLAETGSDRVSLFAMSFGGTIVSSYLYKYGNEHLKNVVYGNTAFLGVDLVGEMLTENLEVQLEAILDYAKDSAKGNDILYGLLGTTRKAIETKYGKKGAKAVDAYLEAVIDVLREPAYQKVFKETYARFPGIWGLMPSSYFEEAKTVLSPVGNFSDSFIQKIDEYMYNVQMKTEALIKAAESDGVNVYIIGSYGFSGTPVTSRANSHTDTLIETHNMTGNSVVAPYGKTLADIKYVGGTTCSNKSHNHASTDGIVDVSTALLPERTWVIKDMKHVEYAIAHGSNDLAVWVVTSEKPVDIYTNESYPQFVQVDRKTGALTSLTEGVTIPTESGDGGEEAEGGILAMLKEYLSKAIEFLKGIAEKLLGKPMPIEANS